ncbi:MULTIHEME_CYTC domain-containing protein [Desulfovibrionales bacterium]
MIMRAQFIRPNRILAFSLCYNACIILAALICLTLLPRVLHAQPDRIIFDPVDLFGKKIRPAPTFDHQKHMVNYSGCTPCHHRFKNGKNVLDSSELSDEANGVRCKDCHAKLGTQFVPDLDQTKTNLHQAYHGQCLHCHQNLGSQGTKTGPRACAACHKP